EAGEVKIPAQRAGLLDAGCRRGTARRKQAAIGRVAPNLQPQAGDYAGSLLVEDLQRPHRAIVNAGDVHLLGAQCEQGRVDVVEALSKAHAPANALIGVIFPQAVAEIELSREA